MTPPLAPEYTVSPRLPTRPASLATMTILPDWRSIIGSMKARETWIGPMRLRSTSFFQNSGVFFTKGSILPQPATLATMSTCLRLA